MRQKSNRRRGIIFFLSVVMAFSAFAVAYGEEGGSSELPKADAAAESEIYPGGQESVDGKNVWVAYDAAYEAAGKAPEGATVKATVTLPENTSAPKGYKLFILKVNEGEDYYPTEENVKEKASAVNGYHCYMIRWVKVNEDGSYDKNDMKTMADVIKGSDKRAEINIEYLADPARLSGPKGARKLLIFNSTQDGELNESVSESVKDVSVADNYYKSFTFLTNQTGPYVFVSKKMTEGYISELAIEKDKMLTGSAPFDGDDKPGNDSSADNRIVRSYDTIQYPLVATFAARQQDVKKTQVKLFFELTINKTATAARFDTGKMLWLGDNYCVEYMDSTGRVVMVMDKDSKFYEPVRDANGKAIRDENGFVSADRTKPIKINAQVSGSDKGKDSYKVASGTGGGAPQGIVSQRLTGWTVIKAAGNEQSVLAGTKGFTTAVEVRNADNGETFEPTFKMWLEGNEENYGEEGLSGTEMTPAAPCTKNVVTATGDKSVTVSAGTNYNLQMKKNTDMSYKNWFDFSRGELVEESTRSELIRLARLEENHGKSNPAEFTENGAALAREKQEEYANYRYGRISCYGITLQLCNDTNNNPDVNRPGKGLKGISLPVGDITFDLNLYSEALSNNQAFEGSDTEYTAILWDYNENVPANIEYNKDYDDSHIGSLKTPNDGCGNGGRRLYWDGESRSAYAKGGAPGNYIACSDGCYYGGDWSLMDNDNKKVNSINDIAGPKTVTGTGKNTTYHFSVSNYDFDFDNQHFPAKDAGNSGVIKEYTTYQRCFSAGCIQVLSVFPMVQKQSEAEIFLNLKAGNLNITTRAGQKLTAKADDDEKIDHEVIQSDNKKRDQIVLYAPGNLTKGNSFNGKYNDHAPVNVSQGFLGTEYWTTSYDCSAFAGDDIWIVSYGMMSSGSDYRMRSMNLLQLFDSRALMIRDNDALAVNQDYDKAFGDDPGTVKFLYAGDPDHPEGYDTNKKEIMEYMNTVREEDLVYSTVKPDIDGNITVNGRIMKCIGVLMEIRGCNLLGGKYQYMRIPVKVKGDDEDLVGRTVATVNTARIWSYDIGEAISWEYGVWKDGQDGSSGRNSLENYHVPGKETGKENYSGEVANKKGSPPYYIKTEYEDGLQKENTHTGGTLSGNSLLILGYKANIHIGVDNKNTTGSITYNQGNGETEVDYRLNNIIAEISDLTGQTQKPVTTLTVKAVLDETRKAGEKQRISVSGDSYYMEGFELDENGNKTGSSKPIAIGSNKENPTQLIFEDGDKKQYKISVYAQLSADRQSVTFVIKDAPVGVNIPDITFKADFASVSALKDNDTIKTGAYISGAGDCRAYSEKAGNMANITVGVVLGSETNLTKNVREEYIELDSNTITYDVIYANRGTETIRKIYFYDLLPHSGDIRGSSFGGTVSLRDFKVNSGGAGSGNELKATVYYSTTEYHELYDRVRIFGGKDETTGTVVERNEVKVEEMLETGTNNKGEKLFMKLGTVENDKFSIDPDLPTDKIKLDELMGRITGLYVKAESLHKDQTIDMQFKVQAEGNKAGDWYKNIANSWIAGSATLPLTSNKVETVAVSRGISGVVWYDWNLNGVRDVKPQSDVQGDAQGGQQKRGVPDEEALLEGVTATLFKKNERGSYEKCEEDIAGQPIAPVTTGKDGAYSFDKLAEGDYIVAFSGDALKSYTDATFYQYGGHNDSDSSDGVKTEKLNEAGAAIPGIDKDEYPYCIRYSIDKPEMKLHSIDDMKNGKAVLNNYREEYSHQDLGVIVAGYELPETGGFGTFPYMAAGLLLMLSAFPVWRFARRRKA